MNTSTDQTMKKFPQKQSAVNVKMIYIGNYLRWKITNNYWVNFSKKLLVIIFEKKKKYNEKKHNYMLIY